MRKVRGVPADLPPVVITEKDTADFLANTDHPAAVRQCQIAAHCHNHREQGGKYFNDPLFIIIPYMKVSLAPVVFTRDKHQITGQDEK